MPNISDAERKTQTRYTVLCDKLNYTYMAMRPGKQEH